MKITMIGVNHETAPVAWREAVSLTETKKIELLESLIQLGVEESIVLSTCGRFELYLATSEEHLAAFENRMIEFLKDFFNKSDFHAHCYCKSEEHAVYHLFKVAIGLDSAVLGEDQILGQVKEALQFGMMIGSSGKTLNALFRDGTASAKRIKTELKISEHPLSLSYIGVKKSKEILGNLTEKVVLVIGLGKMGQLALKSLLEEGVSCVNIAVRNPSIVGVEQFSQSDRERIHIISFEERYAYLETADLVIGATAAPHTVIKAEQTERMKTGALLIDLALPRDFDNQLTEKFPVTLLDVDGLKDISESNAKKRIAIAADAEAMIEADVAAFLKWMDQAEVDTVLNQWHQEIEAIHEDTMSYLKRKLVNCEHRDLMLIDKMLTSSLKRLIRKPVGVLKNIEDNEKRAMAVDLIKELFEYE